MPGGRESLSRIDSHRAVPSMVCPAKPDETEPDVTELGGVPGEARPRVPS